MAGLIDGWMDGMEGWTPPPPPPPPPNHHALVTWCLALNSTPLVPLGSSTLTSSAMLHVSYCSRGMNFSISSMLKVLPESLSVTR
jgi:hypothetical protein